MKIDIAKWENELRIHKNSKHLVHWKVKDGESIFSQCFKRILDPNRHVIPIMFKTNPNLYNPTR